MQPDVRTLLQTEAPTPSGSLDLEDVRARSARVARHRWFLIVASALLVIVAGPAVAFQVFQSETSISPAPGDSPRESCATYGDEADVRVYLSDQSTPDEIATLKAQIEALDEVAAVYYITSEEVLREFKDFNRNEPKVSEPLGPNDLPEVLRVVLHEPDDAEAIANSIPESKIVDQISSGRASPEDMLEQHPAPTVCLKATDPGSK